MIILDEKVEIAPGNIIYNPTENVRYKVTHLAYNHELRSQFVSLEPLPPLGSAVRQFSISFGSMIALGYVVEGERG